MADSLAAWVALVVEGRRSPERSMKYSNAARIVRKVRTEKAQADPAEETMFGATGELGFARQGLRGCRRSQLGKMNFNGCFAMIGSLVIVGTANSAALISELYGSYFRVELL